MSAHRTRAVISALTIAAMTVGGVANAASHKKPAPKKPVRKTQTITINYTASESFHTAAGPASQPCAPNGTVGPFTPCFDVTPQSWARYMTITSTDATGRQLPFSMWAKSTGVNTNGHETFYCGGAKNVGVTQGEAWTLSVDQLSVVTTCPGPATTGSIKIVLSNLP